MEEWRNDVMTGLHYHAISKNKKKQQFRQDLGLYGYSFARY